MKLNRITLAMAGLALALSTNAIAKGQPEPGDDRGGKGHPRAWCRCHRNTIPTAMPRRIFPGSALRSPWPPFVSPMPGRCTATPSPCLRSREHHNWTTFSKASAGRQASKSATFGNGSRMTALRFPGGVPPGGGCIGAGLMIIRNRYEGICRLCIRLPDALLRSGQPSCCRAFDSSAVHGIEG